MTLELHHMGAKVRNSYNNNNNNNNNATANKTLPGSLSGGVTGVQQSQSGTVVGTRPKRDFRFQVIQVHQGPKWFIWPAKKGRHSSLREKRGTTKDNSSLAATAGSFTTAANTLNNNDNINNNMNISNNNNPNATNNNNNRDNNDAINNNNNNSGTSIKITNIITHSNAYSQTVETLGGIVRPQVTNAALVDLTSVDGELTPVSATTQTQHSPNSEPTTRRLSTRPLHHKAQTEPISASVPSSTFKILSICRKWSHGGRSWNLSDSEDFDDDSEDLEENLDECQENCLIVRSYRHLQQQLNMQQHQHTTAKNHSVAP